MQNKNTRWQDKCNKNYTRSPSCWLDIYSTLYLPYVFLKFVFWQLWLVGCAGCTAFGCFWQTNLVRILGSNFFCGPRYVVNLHCLLSDKLRTNNLYSTHICGFNMLQHMAIKKSRLDNESCLQQTQRMTP
jgi:hypothetical protein